MTNNNAPNEKHGSSSIKWPAINLYQVEENVYCKTLLSSQINHYPLQTLSIFLLAKLFIIHACSIDL